MSRVVATGQRGRSGVLLGEQSTPALLIGRCNNCGWSKMSGEVRTEARRHAIGYRHCTIVDEMRVHVYAYDGESTKSEEG